MATPQEEANATNVTVDKVPEIVIFGCIGTITIITNSFLLGIIICKRHLRTASNTLYVSTFVLGILFALLYLIPRWCIPHLNQVPVLCALLPPLGQSFFINFNLHVCSISLERYISIANPFLYDRINKRKNYIGLIATIWLISTVSQYIPLFTFKPIKSVCYYWAEDLVAQKFFLLFIFTILFFIPLTIIIVTYARIYVIVNFHVAQFHAITKLNADEKRLIKDRKAVKQIVAMISVFIISFLPFVIEFLIWQDKNFKGSTVDVIILRITQYLAFSYPAVSPILCCWFKTNLKLEVKRALRLCQDDELFRKSSYSNAYLESSHQFKTVDFSTRQSFLVNADDDKSLASYNGKNGYHNTTVSEKTGKNGENGFKTIDKPLPQKYKSYSTVV